MKLLYCKHCDSVIRLLSKKRICECWKVWWMYLDNVMAVYFGDAITFWIDNISFAKRLRKDVKENISYNIANNLDFDDGSFKAFVFWRSLWCSSWSCSESLDKISKREFNKL